SAPRREGDRPRFRRFGASVIVFLGPSLAASEARAIAPCKVWPPARQGDIWRALDKRPRAIALIDGVFESQPSVWHHEILDALDRSRSQVAGCARDHPRRGAGGRFTARESAPAAAVIAGAAPQAGRRAPPLVAPRRARDGRRGPAPRASRGLRA